MTKNALSQQEIAQLFSNGKFEDTFDFLSKNIVWKIIGESEIKGKTGVISACEKTSQYFSSVDTNFVTEAVIVDKNSVVVTGSAAFIKEGKRINFISACDVYQFNEENFVENISSYCISERAKED